MMHDDVREFLQLFQPELLPTGLSRPTPMEPEREFLLAEGKAAYAAALKLRELYSTATGLGARLMLEELGETLVAAAHGDVEAYADGLADLLYVVLWNAVAHGVPIDAVFAEVHRANMAKAPVCTKCNGSGREVLKLSAVASFFNGNNEEADVACDACAGKGRIVTRDAGKVVKPPGWTPPDIAGVLRRAKAAWVPPDIGAELRAAGRPLNRRDSTGGAFTVTPEAAAAIDGAHLRILASMPLASMMPGFADAKRTRMSETAASLAEWWKLPADPVAELVDREDGKGIDLAPIIEFYTGVKDVHSLAAHEAGPEHPDCTSLLFPGGYVVHIGDPVTQIVKLRNPWAR